VEAIFRGTPEKREWDNLDQLEVDVLKPHHRTETLWDQNNV
jgi:hypothetical protein